MDALSLAVAVALLVSHTIATALLYYSLSYTGKTAAAMQKAGYRFTALSVIMFTAMVAVIKA